MGLLARIVSNPALYVVSYIVVMIPTYVLPYFGSNSHIARGVVSAINTDMGNAGAASALRVPFLIHLALLGLLVLFGYARGRLVGKSWLVVFPGLALAFDMLPVLTLIPLVPTVMHLCAVIQGVVGTSRSTTVPA